MSNVVDIYSKMYMYLISAGCRAVRKLGVKLLCIDILFCGHSDRTTH